MGHFGHIRGCRVVGIVGEFRGRFRPVEVGRGIVTAGVVVEVVTLSFGDRAIGKSSVNEPHRSSSGGMLVNPGITGSVSKSGCVNVNGLRPIGEKKGGYS